ncbi:hypothetical protein [Streptomyces sp. NPDC047928]|uniref:hypothetical protein n=1 Tax=unclassified Streptomyces TaxID=2593676 RepID=UPI0037227AD8
MAPDFMEDGEPLFWDDSEDSFKILGLYSSRRLAEERIERARTLPGFRRSPEGFTVHTYTVDTAHWTDGFRTDEVTDEVTDEDTGEPAAPDRSGEPPA